MPHFPPRMRRVEHPNHARFVTFSCYQRLKPFEDECARDRFEAHLASARQRFSFHLYGWVVMPEHVHLLLWPCLPKFPVSLVLHWLKRVVAQDVIGQWRARYAAMLDVIAAGEGVRFWQRGGGYDRNVFSEQEFAEKLHYIHLNPVKRGLIDVPERWAWSSARWYADREALAMEPLPLRKPVLKN